MPELTARLVVLLVALAAYTAATTVFDQRQRRIPNAVTLPMFLAGWVYQLAFGGLHGLADGAALLALLRAPVAAVSACYDRLGGGEAARLPQDGEALAATLATAGFADPVVIDRDLTRRPSQNASNSPSNRSQSDFRAENRCLNATRNSPGFSA